MKGSSHPVVLCMNPCLGFCSGGLLLKTSSLLYLYVSAKAAIRIFHWACSFTSFSFFHVWSDGCLVRQSLGLSDCINTTVMSVWDPVAKGNNRSIKQTHILSPGYSREQSSYSLITADMPSGWLMPADAVLTTQPYREKRRETNKPFARNACCCVRVNNMKH